MLMFIKRGDGKVLSVMQDEVAEESRKKTAAKENTSEKVKTSDNNQKSGS